MTPNCTNNKHDVQCLTQKKERQTMNQFTSEVLTTLNSTEKFSTEQLKTIEFAIQSVSTRYKISPHNNILVTKDITHPKGYEEYFVYKMMSGIAESTLKMYKYQIDRFLLAVMKPLDEITGEDIALYIHKKRLLGKNSAVTANNIKRCLSSFFTWLCDNEYITKNPIRTVPTTKVPYRLAESLTPDQFEKILNSCTNQRDRAIVAVFGGSGIRCKELINMKLQNLNIKENKFTIIGKGNKERVCFLTARAKYELEKYLKERNSDSPYVFIRRHSPYDKLTIGAVKFMVGELGERAGIHLHPHMFRHYFADIAYNADIDLLDISRMLGHASVGTTQIYISNNTTDLAKKHARIK